MTKLIIQTLKEHTQDAVLFFCQQTLASADSPRSKQDATEEVAKFLAKLEGGILQEQYVEQITKSTKWLTKAQLKKELGTAQEKALAKEASKEKSFLAELPEVDRSSIMKFGFYAKEDGERTGYYFRTGTDGDGEANYKAVTNFVMTPLFHKYDQEDNTRIVRINNGVTPPEVIELPSKALISADSFRTFLFDRGAYFFDGSKTHLDKLNKFHLWSFPKAFELKNLGWQNEGFWAWYNRSFNGKLTNYNEAGLVRHGNMNFFSPASSDIYKNYRQDDDDDQYENDKYLKYQEAQINFTKWADLMNRAYPDHAVAGVLWVIVCLFKDIVFKVDNNAPFLYSYGPSQSGKSKFHESITNLFFDQMPAFNLNSGTDFAFFQRMSRFKNCPIAFNEFNDDVVKDEWFEAIKGAFDGEGRERGRGMSKRKTETQKVNGLIMLAGQYLSTRDDNSVLSRSILRSFKKQTNRPEDQTKAYEELKEFEREGLGSIITELLIYRDKVKERYSEEFNRQMKRLAVDIRKGGELFNERVLRNYTSLLAMHQLFGKEFKLPWSEDDIYDWVKDQVLDISQMISNTDVLVDFWNSLETMFDRGILKEGVHFKIEKEQRVKYHYKGKEEKYKEFIEPTRTLYLRLKNIHQEFSAWKRTTGGKAMDLTSLTSYLKDREYYIGYVDGTRFYRFTKDGAGEIRRQAYSNSAHIFEYDRLKINLLRHDDEIVDNSPEGVAERNQAIQAEKDKDELPF